MLNNIFSIFLGVIPYQLTKKWIFSPNISDFSQIYCSQRTFHANFSKLNFLKIGWGFMKLWNVQNGFFLWSRMQSKYFENHHLTLKSNYSYHTCFIIIKFWKYVALCMFFSHVVKVAKSMYLFQYGTKEKGGYWKSMYVQSMYSVLNVYRCYCHVQYVICKLLLKRLQSQNLLMFFCLFWIGVCWNGCKIWDIGWHGLDQSTWIDPYSSEKHKGSNASNCMVVQFEISLSPIMPHKYFLFWGAIWYLDLQT